MMKKIKLLTVVGARPQFVKAAMLSHAIKQGSVYTEIMVHTGQHYDENMSKVFFDELGLDKPHYTLDINNLSHGAMTGEMLIKLEEILLTEKPDAVVVYGDTDSTLAGALAAAKLDIPVVHIEAGLRSYNRKMPEEINRVLTDHVSTLLFCPTKSSVDKLESENIIKSVFLVGDIMHDLIAYVKTRGESNNDLLESLGLDKSKYILLTLHRAENTNDIARLQDLLSYTRHFAEINNLKVYFPIHPRTRKVCDTNNIDLTGFEVIEPVGYFDMQGLVAKSEYVFTDSGGLQKEAYFHKVPCVTLRDETEWVETISHGWNRLWNAENYLERAAISEYEVEGSVANNILDQINNFL